MKIISFVFYIVLLICDQCLSLCNQTFQNALAKVSLDGETFLQEHLNGCLENRPLKIVHVTGCVQALYSESLTNMLQLSEIHLEGVGLRHISRNFMKNVPVLKTIRINFNPLNEISEDVFANFHLNNLNISSNMITTLGRDSFKNVGLFYLDLSRNRLNNVNHETFHNSNIKFLYLQHNKIVSLSKNTFDGTNGLQLIHLGYNNIYHIQDTTFKRLGSEGDPFLLLQGNSLTNVNFLSETNLKYLDVGLNKISYIFLKNSTSVTTMCIHPNPWHCQCLREFWKRAKKGNFTVEDVSRPDEEPVCIATSAECSEDYNYDSVRQIYFDRVSYSDYWVSS